MRNLFASVVMCVVLAGTGEASHETGLRPTGEPVCEGAVLEQAWQLLESAQFGRSRREHAAFIVRRPDGTAELDHWPFEAEIARASFRGSAPAGTVAIIHTHPNELEYPSEGDQRLARRLGLPVYVVTRTRVSRTDGESIETIWSGNWDPRLGGRYGRSRCPDASVAMTVAAAVIGNR